MRLWIDTAICTGHGRCYSLVPELFETDDSGYGIVTCEEIDESQVERARSAVQNCPEHAIRIDAE
jgi:ferredoxin